MKGKHLAWVLAQAGECVCAAPVLMPGQPAADWSPVRPGFLGMDVCHTHWHLASLMQLEVQSAPKSSLRACSSPA